MRDAVTSLIRNYDTTGRYFDRDAIESLKDYFASGNDRITVAAMINSQSAEIVKAAANSLFEAVPELLLAGGNAYTTRRFSACLRDMDYYLRYATYAMLAGDPSILDERVLNGLKETYNSLGVPIGATVQAIQAMKEVTAGLVGADAGKEMGIYFDYICSGLS